MEGLGGVENAQTNAISDRKYSENKPTIRATAKVLMKPGEKDAEIVTKNYSQNPTSKITSSLITQYEDLNCEASSMSRLKTFNNNVDRKSCDPVVRSVENSSILKQTPGVTPTQNIQHVASECETSKHASSKSANNNGYRMNCDTTARSVRNNCKLSTTTRVITSINRQEQGGSQMASLNSTMTSVSDIYQGDGADSTEDYTVSENEMSQEDDMEESEFDKSEIDDAERDEEEMKDESEEELYLENDADPEEPPTWYEAYTLDKEYRQPVLRKINANDRVAISAELPTIAATNTRSIGPKIRNFAEDMIQRQITVCLVSETWEKQTQSRKFKNEIERIFELSGLKFISCPRPTNKRGGGAAIVVDTAKFSCERLNIVVPGNLECVWAILRPKNVTKSTQFKEIILCAFYSPPKSRKNAKLLDHLISTLHLLLTKYPSCGWVAGGDKNQFPLAPLLGALPKCRQIVTKYTYKGIKIYDVLLTNLGKFYSVPYIAPAVQPDDPSTGAVPSDHDTAVAEPLAGTDGAATREYRVKSSRPFPESGLRNFGSWMNRVRWEGELTWDMDSTQQALKMELMLQVSVDAIFPTKRCRISSDDKPFITAELKKLDMYVKREYKLKGKSEKYKKIKSVYDRKFQRAASEYLQGCVQDMMEEQPGKAYRAMRKLGARPGDCDDEAGFTLTSHVEENLTPKQSVERIADYFSAISQQYSPLHVHNLPKSARDILEAPVNTCDIPVIEPYQVWEMMKAGRKTKSSVPGELPARLRHEFGPELAQPAAIIFNNIARSGQWVEHWRHGAAIPLKKCDNPKDEAQTRIIEITYYLSLQIEKFVLKWLLQFISDKIDRDQFGGAKGHSVAHYLIEIINFVLYNQDFTEPVASLLTAVDIHKGFNKVDHSKAITILATTMQVPGWLLRIVASYLTDRTLSIRYRKETSSIRRMPGGTGAGTVLGLNLFLILFNGAGPEANMTSIGQQITKPLNRRQPIKKSKAKWIDDVTICTALDLKNSLVPEDRPVPRPLPYHARTEHRLPRALNSMQDELDQLRQYTDHHLMAINESKTKGMLCNTRRKWDVFPELSVNYSDNIEIVEEMKIVGFVMRSDMKTKSNTAYITAKAYKRMWFVRRLKALGASTNQLVDSLQKQVLSVLWLGAGAWFCQLTQQEKSDINRVAKVGLKIIYDQNYGDFDQALLRANILKPTDQLAKMAEKFTVKCAKHIKV